MKKISIFLIALLALASTHAFGHFDTSNMPSASGDAGQSNCYFCHTPHGIKTNEVGIPLWNGNLISPPDTAFVLYGETVAGTDIGMPGGISKLCFSCHDGAMATIRIYAGGEQFDMRSNHPIGFEVNPTLAGLASLEEMSAVGAVFFGEDKKTMECATCHDPHSKSSEKPYLRLAGNADICMGCHSRF